MHDYFMSPFSGAFSALIVYLPLISIGLLSFINAMSLLFVLVLKYSCW